MTGRRREKLGVFVKEQVSLIINREVEFPHDDVTTVTRVDIAPDGQYATVFISSLAERSDRAVEILQKNVFRIQKIFNHSARMRPVPKIIFAQDKEGERREGVEKTLAGLKRGHVVK